MRANITLSVEVDELPEEVKKIIQLEAEKLNNLFYEIGAYFENGNYIEARNAILKLRKGAGNLDIRLYELDQIMAGYINILNDSEQGFAEPPEQEATQETDPPPEAEQPGELEQELGASEHEFSPLEEPPASFEPEGPPDELENECVVREAETPTQGRPLTAVRTGRPFSRVFRMGQLPHESPDNEDG